MRKDRGRRVLSGALGASLVLGMLACDQAAANPRELTAEEWREDLAFLAEKLPEKHGNAFHQVSKFDFEAAVVRLEEQIPNLAAHQVLAEMGRLVASVGDGHTELWLPQEGTGFRRLPVAFGYFGEDLYIFAATQDHTDLLGKRILSIGDVAVSEAYERVVPLIGRDNVYEYLRSAPIYFAYPEILHAVGLSASVDEVVLTVADGIEGDVGNESGETGGVGDAAAVGAVGPVSDAGPDTAVSKVILRAMSAPSAEWTSVQEAAGSEPPLYLQQRDRWYWYEYLEDSRTLYLQYDRCRDQPGELSIKKFARELFEFVDSQSVERFVIDLRHNTGGNLHRNEPLIEGIRSRTKTINRRGKLFVITSRTTFSAATIAAIDLARQTEAILVGEPSRGKPNGYSDEKHLRLPNSNIEVNYSPLYREAMPELGDAPFLPVDKPVTPTFDDYRAGRDPVMAAVLAYDLLEAGVQ